MRPGRGNGEEQGTRSLVSRTVLGASRMDAHGFRPIVLAEREATAKWLRVRLSDNRDETARQTLYMVCY